MLHDILGCLLLTTYLSYRYVFRLWWRVMLSPKLCIHICLITLLRLVFIHLPLYFFNGPRFKHFQSQFSVRIYSHLSGAIETRIGSLDLEKKLAISRWTRKICSSRDSSHFNLSPDFFSSREPRAIYLIEKEVLVERYELPCTSKGYMLVKKYLALFTWNSP